MMSSARPSELGGGFGDSNALKESNIAGAVLRTYAREEGVHAGFLLPEDRRLGRIMEFNGVVPFATEARNPILKLHNSPSPDLSFYFSFPPTRWRETWTTSRWLPPHTLLEWEPCLIRDGSGESFFLCLT